MLPDQQQFDGEVRQTHEEDGDDLLKWSQRAHRAYEDSSDYYDSSLSKSYRDNVAHAQSNHASGSKYNSDAYRQRSKLFRPKTKAFLRQSAASVASGLFSNQDVVDMRGANPNNPLHADAAKLIKALVQHRLDIDIPWFQTVLGANYDADVYGICISKTYWDYGVHQPEPEYRPVFDENGEPIVDDDGIALGEELVQEPVLISDKPVIDLIPPENLRFDPNADWRDIVGTSPYLIEMMSMYAVDVLQMLSINNPGEPIQWIPHDINEIVTIGTRDVDGQQNTVNKERYEGREDPQEMDQAQEEYKSVWVHLNILKDEQGKDWAFYTLGSKELLSVPMPIEELFINGREVYQIGFKNVETHKTVPESHVGMFNPVQEEINEICNQRHDNIKLVLNKRYALRRGANIDMSALMRNVPGGGVLMDDPGADYKIMETPDVTGSSYSEHDRLSIEGDELLGNFSQASVQSNRSLHETVGGMNLMSSTASAVQELDLRLFVETWVEPVLRNLVTLVKEYETDEVKIALAANKANILAEIDDALFMQDLVVKVNVGMGNTNPQQKIERLMTPINTVMQFPEFAARLKLEEVAKELFAITGLGDGERFVMSEEEFAELQEQMMGQEPPVDPSIQVAQINAEARLAAEQIESEVRERVEMARLAQSQGLKMEELYTKLGIEQQKDRTKREQIALESQIRRHVELAKYRNQKMGFDSY
jgi:hypothetical protein